MYLAATPAYYAANRRAGHDSLICPESQNRTRDLCTINFTSFVNKVVFKSQSEPVYVYVYVLTYRYNNGNVVVDV